MTIELFGFGLNFKKKKKNKEIESIVPKNQNDGAVELENGIGSIHYVQNFETTWKNDTDLINQYRASSLNTELESAIDDIVNDAIVFDPGILPVEINLDKVTNFSEVIHNKIKEEFNEILRMLNFNNEGDEIFRRWYVDGKQYYHIVVDDKHLKDGIKDIRYIDPRWIKKVREIQKIKNDKGIEVVGGVKEYYIYAPIGKQGSTQKLELSPASVVYTHSGLFDPAKNIILSYLHQALKPFNQLRSIEDSLVIYRISRAPEKRIFYIDVGNLPKTKAEAYLKSIINKYKNKIVYDVNTGSVKDSLAHRTVLEDIWLPRREGSRGTEVDTLDGGQNLGELEDVIYFRKKLYKSLHLPLSRLEQESSFNLGRSGEITRDELKFSKFIEKLRKKFSNLFYKLLKVQLILKNIITVDDWDNLKEQIMFSYNKDSYFSELKEAEIIGERIEMLGNIDEYVGKYFSAEWVKKNILKQTDDDITEMKNQIDSELEDGDIDKEDGGADNDGIDKEDDTADAEEKDDENKNNKEDDEEDDKKE